MAQVTPVGIDLAKHVFSLHGVEGSGGGACDGRCIWMS